MKLLIFRGTLREHCSHANIRHVNLQHKLQSWVGWDQDGSRGALLLEDGEVSVSLRSPVEGGLGGGESRERGCQNTVVSNELTIKIGETKESLELLEGTWS